MYLLASTSISLCKKDPYFPNKLLSAANFIKPATTSYTYPCQTHMSSDFCAVWDTRRHRQLLGQSPNRSLRCFPEADMLILDFYL